MQAQVSLMHIKSLNGLAHDISNAINGYPEFVRDLAQAHTILLKPNVMGCHSRERGRTTDPVILSAIVESIKEFSQATIAVADSSVVGVDTLKAFEVTGMVTLAETHNVALIDLRSTEHIVKEVAEPLAVRKIRIAKPVIEADVVINVPKLKTTPASPISVGMKNLKGVLTDQQKRLFHRIGLQECLVDLYSQCRPNFTIVDGFIASAMGVPVEAKVLLCGDDGVAVDAIAASFMQIDVPSSCHLALAGAAGLGVSDLKQIRVIGEAPYVHTHPFRVAPNNSIGISIPGKITIVEKNPCSGCIGILEKGLSDLQREIDMDIWGDEIVIYVGDGLKGLSPVNPAKSIIMGNCTIKQCNSSNSSHRLYGCPPTINELIKLIARVRAFHDNSP